MYSVKMKIDVKRIRLSRCIGVTMRFKVDKCGFSHTYNFFFIELKKENTC